MVVTSEEEGWGEDEEGKGVKYTVRESDYVSGSEHTMEYIDVVLQNCTDEITKLLINVIPILKNKVVHSTLTLFLP